MEQSLKTHTYQMPMFAEPDRGLIVDNFAGGGDSGSLIVFDGKGKRGRQDDRRPVGLLFAGNRFFGYAIANPIDVVLTRFGVTIVGD